MKRKRILILIILFTIGGGIAWWVHPSKPCIKFVEFRDNPGGCDAVFRMVNDTNLISLPSRGRAVTREVDDDGIRKTVSAFLGLLDEPLTFMLGAILHPKSGRGSSMSGRAEVSRAVLYDRGMR